MRCVVPVVSGVPVVAIKRAAAAAERATVTAGAVPAVAAPRAAAAPGAAWTRGSGPPDRRHAGARPAPAPGGGHRPRGHGVPRWRLVPAPHATVLGSSITVFGNVHETAAQVEAQAALGDHPPLLDVDAGAAATRIEQLPWVRTAAVHVSWPDGVQITVTEETPRFVVSAPGGGWDSLSSDGPCGVLSRPPAGIAVVDRSAAAGRSRLCTSRAMTPPGWRWRRRCPRPSPRR